MEVTARAQVAVPVEKVWEVLADHEGMSSWAPGGLLRARLEQEGDDERCGVGAVRRLSPAGPGPDIVEEVVRFRAPHVLGYRARSGVPFRGYRGEVVLHPRVDGGTDIVWTLVATPRLPTDKPALALLVRVLLGAFVRRVRRG